jgi:hypothetical protein
MKNLHEIAGCFRMRTRPQPVPAGTPATRLLRPRREERAAALVIAMYGTYGVARDRGR